MQRYKIKCTVCGQKHAKYINQVDGEYFNKPICRICLKRLLMADKIFADNVEEHSKKLKKMINFMIVSSIFTVLLGVLIYCMAFYNNNSIINIFSEQSKLIYFLLFTAINYLTGYIVSDMTESFHRWLRILINVLFAVMLSLVACVVIIRDDIQWMSIQNPYLFILPFMAILFGVIFFLNYRRSVDKSKLLIVAFVSAIISVGTAIIGLCFCLF